MQMQSYGMQANAEGRTQASVWSRRSCSQEHRRLQTAFLHHSHFSRAQWYEQDGDQSSGQAIRDERRLHHRQRARGSASGRQDFGFGRQGSAGGDRRWCQFDHFFHRRAPSKCRGAYPYGPPPPVEILDVLVEKSSENMDVHDKDQVISQMKAALASKQFGQEDILSSLVADACIQVCPKKPANFNVDNVRVAKLLGGVLHNSTVVRGMVSKTDTVGSIKRVEKAKVAVFAGGVDTSATETKGTVLIHSAEQLENYVKTEEAKVEELIKAVADSGTKVIVSGAAVGEMALHFCECYKLMVLKISSKFELRRFCRTTGAVSLLKLSQPNPEDLGYVDFISVEEIGGVRVTTVKNEEGGNSVAMVVLRGSTDSILDDLERVVDDGVNTYKAMCSDSRIVPGAATTEIELARRVKEFSFKETGLDQYAVAKFAESFEVVPKTLAENARLNAMEIISSLYAEHASGNAKVGIDLEEGVFKDVSTMNIWDLHITSKLSRFLETSIVKFEHLTFRDFKDLPLALALLSLKVVVSIETIGVL